MLNRFKRLIFMDPVCSLVESSTSDRAPISMHDERIPVTTAVRFLREKKIAFEPFFYDYVEHGGTRVAAESLSVSEHAVVKTLVMETELREPLIVLMHGDCEVSTKQLARTIGANRVAPCDEQRAHKHTGYVVGGISPFGTRGVFPVYAEETIFDLPIIYVNGGKRGFLVGVNPSDIERVLGVTRVHVALPASG